MCIVALSGENYVLAICSFHVKKDLEGNHGQHPTLLHAGRQTVYAYAGWRWNRRRTEWFDARRRSHRNTGCCHSFFARCSSAGVFAVRCDHEHIFLSTSTEPIHDSQIITYSLVRSKQGTFPWNDHDCQTTQVPTLPAPVIGTPATSTPAAKAPVAVDADAGELAELESLFWSSQSIVRGFFFSVDKKEYIHEPKILNLLFYYH